MAGSIRIGAYTLQGVIAGRFKLDGGAMFGVVPRVLWEPFHPPDGSNRIELVNRSLLIRGGGRVILVDTGIGQTWSADQRSIYAINESVDLPKALHRLGCATDEVTDVILTHLHFDHIGGNLWPEDGTATFPNANHYVQEKHFAWANNPSERDRVSFIAKYWQVLGSQLHMVTAEQALLPGIELRIVHGHTPFQQLPLISDGTTTLLCCSDLIPLASQVKIPWIMGYDLRPLETIEEKKRILTEAAENDWFLFLEHDPEVELCRVTATADGFALR